MPKAGELDRKPKFLSGYCRVIDNIQITFSRAESGECRYSFMKFQDIKNYFGSIIDRMCLNSVEIRCWNELPDNFIRQVCDELL